jgi:hypothetical protein
VDTYEHNHLLFDAGNEAILKKNDLTVSLGFMPSYGMEMEVRPSENGVMTGAKQQGDNKFLPFLCVQVYHFTYDLIFPVEVGIVRENAFKDGSPLTLRFALPVQIQRNLPNQDDFSITTTVDTPGGRLCDQKVNYQTQIIATDIFTGQQINGANVEFHCYKYACELGKTSKLQSYDPELTTSLPSFCSGGSVSISHPQYITNEEAFYEAPQKIDLRMIPLKNISFSVMLGPNPRSNNAQPSELNVNQQAIVQLTSQEIDYQTAIAYPGDPSMANIIQLVAAKAKYNATVLVYETTDGENGQLIGGYIGELDVRLTANLNQRLTFYAYDFGQPVNPEDLPDAMNTLTTNEIIKAAHSPGWG